MKKIPAVEWGFVIVFLLFAAGLRFVGVTFGQPDPGYAPSTYPRQMLHYQTPLQPDEYEFVAIPLEMVLKKTLTPGYVNRGFITSANFVTFLVTGAGDGLSLEEDRAGVNSREYAPFHLYVIGRVYSALGGLLAVAATYAIARQIFGRFAAACAGLLTAVALTMVQHAHYTTPSSLAAGFTMLAIWSGFASLCTRRERSVGWLFALSGAAAGFAAASRYNAAGVAIVLGLTGLILLYRQRSWRMIRLVAAGWVLFPLAFVVAVPQFVLEFQNFWEHFLYAVNQYTAGESVLFAIDKNYGLLLEYRYLIVFNLGIPASLLAVVGIYAAWKKSVKGPARWSDFVRQNTPFLFAGMLLVYLVAYSVIVLRTVRPDGADQLLLPVIPVFAVLTGVGAAWLYDRFPRVERLLAPGLVLAVIIVPLVSSVQFVHLLAQPDTRQVMQAWIYQHIPRGSRIYLNGPYNVPLDPADYRFTQTFGYDLKPLEEVQNKFDYILLSEVWYYSIQRSPEIIPADYIQQVDVYLRAYRQNLVEIARIDAPAWTGYDWMGHMPSYWHNPGLIVYCTRPESCAAVG